MKWQKKITVCQNKNTQREANSLRKTTEYFAFTASGKLHTYWKLVEDASADNVCLETYYVLKQYHSNGKKARYYQMQCDCHREKEKTYNDKGKLLTKKKAVIKRLY